MATGAGCLQAAPPGVAGDGPAGRFLLHKALFVHHDQPIDHRVHSDAIVEGCGQHWRALAPLHRWLTDKVET
jgi:hypothetical protein